jgi:hypothetical protein
LLAALALLEDFEWTWKAEDHPPAIAKNTSLQVVHGFAQITHILISYVAIHEIAAAK